MNEPSPDARVQQRIREFLEAVDRALAGAAVPPDERSGILDDLRTQIAEMLAARAGNSPTLSDVDEVLATIDPPASYSQSPTASVAASQPSPHRNPLAILRDVLAGWRSGCRPESARLAHDASVALLHAEQEARLYNHEYIGTEHLLLGLLREKEGVAGKALQRLGLDLGRARSELEAMIRPGPGLAVPKALPRTVRLKKALALADRSAGELPEARVGTEHLLLGLLGVPECLASRLLTERASLTPDTILRELRQAG